MKLEIRPLIGVSDLEFGLTQRQIEAILGPADGQRMDDGEELRERRRANDLQVVYANKGERLVELGFGRSIRELEFYGVKLFEVSEEQALAVIRKTGVRAYETLG